MNRILATLFLIFFVYLGINAMLDRKRAPVDLYKNLRQKNEIIIGTKEDSKPFGFYENGELKGFDVDVARLVFSKVFPDKKLKFVPVTAENRITKLSDNEIDFIVATMSITSQRAGVVDFSLPYFTAGQAVLVNKNSKIKNISTLNNKKVAVVMGTTSEKTLRTLIPNVIVVGCKNYKEAFLKILNNEVVAIFGDDVILYGVMNEKKYKDFEILDGRFTKEYYAIAFKKEKNNDELKLKINEVIDDIMKDGRLNKIKNTWIRS